MIKAFVIVLLAGCVGAPPSAPPPAANPPPAEPPPAPPPPSQGSGSGSGSAVAPLTATQYLHQRGVMLCTEEFTCRSSYPATGGVTFEQMYGASAADCSAFADAADRPSAVESEILANHISYTASLAASCLAGITFPSDCSTFWTSGANYPSACGAALRGLVADGDPCVVDYDCLNTDSYCDMTVLVCTPKLPL